MNPKKYALLRLNWDTNEWDFVKCVDYANYPCCASREKVVKRFTN